MHVHLTEIHTYRHLLLTSPYGCLRCIRHTRTRTRTRTRTSTHSHMHRPTVSILSPCFVALFLVSLCSAIFHPFCFSRPTCSPVVNFFFIIFCTHLASFTRPHRCTFHHYCHTCMLVRVHTHTHARAHIRMQPIFIPSSSCLCVHFLLRWMHRGALHAYRSPYTLPSLDASLSASYACCRSTVIVGLCGSHQRAL